MQEKSIDEIIRAVLTRQATREELSILNTWLSESRENQQIFQQLEMLWHERTEEPQLINAEQLSEQIWEKGTQTNEILLHRRQSTNTYAYYAKIAAIVLLVLSLPLLVFVYTNLKSPANTAVRIITKKNPIGRKLKVPLPDGSIAWLNAESELRYAENFEGSSRFIELTGEAYFEVKKDKHKPFIVQSSKISTTAIGTSFNISAYPEDSTVAVALLSGKVNVQPHLVSRARQAFFLQPGHGLNYHKNTAQIRKYQFDELAGVAWKQGILVFEGDSFAEVKKKLRRWYGIDITMTGIPPQDWKLTGRFKNEYLTAVLENIRFGRNFTYTFKNNQLNFIFHPTKP